MIVKNLIQTCEACPSQWEFRTSGNRYCYVRYRWGILSIRIGPPDSKDVMDAVMGDTVYYKRHGHEYDGFISWDVVEPIVRAIDLPS